MDAEQRGRLLFFCTGSTRVPATGFANLQVGPVAVSSALPFRPAADLRSTSAQKESAAQLRSRIRRTAACSRSRTLRSTLPVSPSLPASRSTAQPLTATRRATLHPELSAGILRQPTPVRDQAGRPRRRPAAADGRVLLQHATVPTRPPALCCPPRASLKPTKTSFEYSDLAAMQHHVSTCLVFETQQPECLVPLGAACAVPVGRALRGDHLLLGPV